MPKKQEHIGLIFPHQLFERNPLLAHVSKVYLIEEYLFFEQFNFHKAKLAHQRASMRFYSNYLQEQGAEVHYISEQPNTDVRVLINGLSKEKALSIHFIDPIDDWLMKRVKKACDINYLEIRVHATPQFLTPEKLFNSYFKSSKKRYFHAQFYKKQRQELNILMLPNEQPEGGKWSFDEENRKKYPKKQIPPALHFPEVNADKKEAIQYVEQKFPNALGSCSSIDYPTTFKEARTWLEAFLHHRFHDFGAYEDALAHQYHFLNHSVLSMSLNNGLLTPHEVVEKALTFGKENNIPLNSIEGFVRQIIGWREFIRGVYVTHGAQQRSKNFWNFKRKIPESFYTGTTGIYPVDHTIKKLLSTSYSHHIERLMVLGSFMLLCEFDPDEVYRWFMELFIDSYDWVMVPNVYGMSQFADGGFFATKPYISGSNYLKKMGDYPKGEWEEIWDGLFWRFIATHTSFFKSNPRLALMVRSYEKMDAEKKMNHMSCAERFLATL